MKLLRYLFPISILFFLYRLEAHTMNGVAMTSFMEYDSDSGSTSIMIMLFGLISLYLIFLNYRGVHNVAKTKAEKSLTRFMCYVYLISIAWSVVTPFQSRNIYISAILPLLFFCAQKMYTMNTDIKYITYSAFVLFALMTYQYIQNYTQVRLLGSATTANNASYFVLYLMPFLLCLKNSHLKIIALVVVGIVVVSSYKRGGTIAFLLACIVYYYIKNIKQVKAARRGGFILVLGVLLIGGFVFLSNSDNTIVAHLFDRFSNINQDNGSGRSDAFLATWNMLLDSNVFSIVIGHGWNMVERTSPIGISAHNDFLECLYDFGVIGLFLLFNTISSFYKYAKQLICASSIYAAPFCASGVLFLSNAMVSHIIIYPYYFLLFGMFWAYVFYSSEQYESLSI